MSQFIDTIIIGAGAAGLAISNLLQQDKNEFLCLESHRTPGGCAGYFSRGKFIFDAGATTLSGLKYQGPLSKFLEASGIELNLRKVDPGLIISLAKGDITRFSDQKSWIDEQQKIFKADFIPELWTEIEKANELCWKLAEESANFPPHNFSSALKLLSKKIPSKLRALPLLLKSFDDYFLKELKISQEYREMLDELLLISTQNTTRDTPAMMAVMGLSYPQDTWYHEGGMKGFNDSLLLPIKDQILFGHKVTSIAKIKDFYHIQTSKGQFKSRRIISSIPTWNTQKLLDIKITEEHQVQPWGALTAYFKVKLNSEIPLYHQVHTKGISHSGSGSVFFSFCPKDDLSRSDGIYQTLTLSTHIRYQNYVNAISESRDMARVVWKNEFLKVVQDYLGTKLLDIIPVGLGDPDTFIEYTERFNGLVGGIPHSMKRSPLNFSPKSPFKDLYQIGDTVFPGQGIVGVIQGAINLHQRIARV